MSELRYIFIVVIVTYTEYRSQHNLYADDDLKRCKQYINDFKFNHYTHDDKIRSYPVYEYAQFGEVENRLNNLRINHYWIQKIKVML